MNIGQVSKESGVPAKTIRYYEEVGLLERAARGENGYRTYGDRDVQVLRFIQRARRLGFSVPDVSKLLGLWSDRSRASADVKELASRHIDEIDKRIEELKGMRKTLSELVKKCHGDDRPDCPIIDGLAETGGACH